MKVTTEIPAAARRAPQARSIATRRRLLRATLESLVERGYAGTTTPEIARRAGVSQGAVFKHFPSKLALYAAATEDLFIELVADYRRDFEQAEKGDDPVGFAVSLLWRTFGSDELQAAFELYMACRTDQALRSAVAPVLARHRENLRNEARRLFPEHRALPRFDAALDTLMDAMQGRVLGSAVLPEPENERAEIAYLSDLMRRELAAAAAAAGHDTDDEHEAGIMSNLIYLAFPIFGLTMALEYALLRRRRGLPGYELRDSAASVTMGLGNVVVAALLKFLVVAVYIGLYQFRFFEIESTPWMWALVLLGDDFCYYWFHRLHHEVRLLWAAHVNHHSSQRYNLSTALRQSWTTPLTGIVFWAPLALQGFPPKMIATAQAISLLYQYWIHTELIGKLGPFEWVFNTPSHHRVHHGRNVQYLDRNYGGILIVWDRLFGSFEPEAEAVDYGITKNLQTFNPVRIAFHEFAAIARDLTRARSLREAFGTVFFRPGWSVDGSSQTAPQLQAQRVAALGNPSKPPSGSMQAAS